MQSFSLLSGHTSFTWANVCRSQISLLFISCFGTSARTAGFLSIKSHFIAWVPELRVVPEGLLKGFVVVNTRWSGFSMDDYVKASSDFDDGEPAIEMTDSYEAEEGDFDLRGFEIASLDLFDPRFSPHMKMADGVMRFSQECIKRIKTDNYIEILIHPRERKIAVRRATRDNRNAVMWAKLEGGRQVPREIPCAAFSDTFFSLFGWNKNYRYAERKGVECRVFKNEMGELK